MISTRDNAVYNSPIAEMRIPSSGSSSRAGSLLIVFCLCWTSASYGAAWGAPAQELSRKIAAVTGTSGIALSVVNRSSLSKKDADDIGLDLRLQLESVGVHSVKLEQAAATVQVSLSENLQSYVWVAEIHRGATEFSVAIVSLPRPDSGNIAPESSPLTLRKTQLWAQERRILDLAVLEESSNPTRMAVLDPVNLGIYKFANGHWQPEQLLPVPHSRPWPRDLRGRLVMRQDHGLDVYLPGVLCQSSGAGVMSLTCRDGDDPWPLSSQFAVAGFFAPTRNFFTGVLAPGIGRQTSIAKFYAAAPIPRLNYNLWVFAMIDGTVHLLDGTTELVQRPDWGSNLSGIKTTCGSGWQILTAQAGSNSSDAIRAYEIPDRDPVPVSASVDFAGTITALWSETRGTTAIAVSRNAETGVYEASRLAVVCGQ